jgi:hypothetical protein
MRGQEKDFEEIARRDFARMRHPVFRVIARVLSWLVPVTPRDAPFGKFKDKNNPRLFPAEGYRSLHQRPSRH